MAAVGLFCGRHVSWHRLACTLSPTQLAAWPPSCCCRTSWSSEAASAVRGEAPSSTAPLPALPPAARSGGSCPLVCICPHHTRTHTPTATATTTTTTTHTQDCAAPPCWRGMACASPPAARSAFPHPSPHSCMPAGLCCAALLARYGMRVTVCESHYLPGGAAHSFEVAGHSFDAGPSFFAGIAGGPVCEHARLLSQFGPARVRQQSPSIPALAGPSSWTLRSTGPPGAPSRLRRCTGRRPAAPRWPCVPELDAARCLDLCCPQGRWAPPPLTR
jgi:hypothetical protein